MKTLPNPCQLRTEWLICYTTKIAKHANSFNFVQSWHECFYHSRCRIHQYWM